MAYYSVSFTSEVGPIHIAIFTDCHSKDRYYIRQAIAIECHNRKLDVPMQWRAESISRYEYRYIVANEPEQPKQP